MERGPRRRVVQRVLDESLTLIRRYGEQDEESFAQSAEYLPDYLRMCAAHLENPPEDITVHPELPGYEGYSRWAGGYDQEGTNPVINAEESVIWGLIGEARGLRVLDVGCGTGRHAIPLVRQGAQVVGIEPSPEMLARALQKACKLNLSIDLREGCLDALPSDPGEFDLVLCCLVLSHVSDIDQAVLRLARNLRPGGRLIVSDFHPFNLLIGFRTAFTFEGQKYIVPNYLHLPSAYFQAVKSAGLTLISYYEKGEWVKLPGVPTAIIMEARK